MNKTVRKSVSKIFGEEFEHFCIIYGAGQQEILKKAWLTENGFSYADGYEKGFNDALAEIKRSGKDFWDRAEDIRDRRCRLEMLKMEGTYLPNRRKGHLEEAEFNDGYTASCQGSDSQES